MGEARPPPLREKAACCLNENRTLAPGAKVLEPATSRRLLHRDGGLEGRLSVRHLLTPRVPRGVTRLLDARFLARKMFAE